MAARNVFWEVVKTVRRYRLLQTSRVYQKSKINDRPIDFLNCSCGNANCIELCDIRRWLPTSKLDPELWNLIIVLGESYLAFGQAHLEIGQMLGALKIAELASYVYESLPQPIADLVSRSSMIKWSFSGDLEEVMKSNGLTFNRLFSILLFWAKLCSLVGDAIVEVKIGKYEEVFLKPAEELCRGELSSSSVSQEVRMQRDSVMSASSSCGDEWSVSDDRKHGSGELIFSSFFEDIQMKNDRVMSGSSASSSSGDNCSASHNRKRGKSKRSQAKSSSNNQSADTRDRVMSGSSASSRGRDDCSVSNGRKHGKTLQDKSSSNNRSADTRDVTAKHSSSKMRDGNKFKNCKGPVAGELEKDLVVAVSCYEEARMVMQALPTYSAELCSSKLHSALEKKARLCKKLGEVKLERHQFKEACAAFTDATKVLRDFSDYANIIRIYCLLGKVRRTAAEEIMKAETFQGSTIFNEDYKQTLEDANEGYRESVMYYEAAVSQLNWAIIYAGRMSYELTCYVYTEMGTTYTGLGMLLAREDSTAEVYEISACEDILAPGKSSNMRKYKISADCAYRKALSAYECTGDKCTKGEAYTYFQLGCYQRDLCLKFLEANKKKLGSPGAENSVLQKAKEYVLEATENWKKAMDFYVSDIYPTMYLTILLERSAFQSTYASTFHTNDMLDSAVTILLEACHVSESSKKSFERDTPELSAKFWMLLQILLKNMLSKALRIQKSSPDSDQLKERSMNPRKLRELYRMSLKSSGFSDLQDMFSIWIA